jgi:N-acetylmuramoyl-L-alanine amidase
MSSGRRLFLALAFLLPFGLASGLVWLSMSARWTERTENADTAAEDPASAGGSPDATPAPPPAVGGPGRPLRGRMVVLDPGHNPGNSKHARETARSVDIGTGRKECDTVGAASGSGYPEAEFNLDVARKAGALLRARGATVRFTHDGDRPYGPCIDERAKSGNRAGADAVVSVHADGSDKGNRGFHVILPAAVQEGGADTTGITASSRRLGERVAEHFAAATGAEPAGYLGDDVRSSGLTTRDDLGGLNLSQVPKVFLECGNMRDPEDSALLEEPAWRSKAARGIADGIATYLTGKR